MPAHISHRRYLLILAGVFAVWWALLAIAPVERGTWLLENVLVLAFALTLGSTYRAFPLSRISYTLIFVFLCLHEIGAHYTYAKVPWNDWIVGIAGFSPDESLGFTRNHFDRSVHFSYGLLLAYPVREVFIRVAQVRGFWAYFLPLDITMSTSMLFELFEWGAAELVGGGLGAAYLGTQGDIWDAHKDMSLASLGAVVAMTATAAINVSLHRDFAADWAESLRVKGRRPLGENAIRQMLRRLRAGRGSSR
jgi:putative membrane protein